MQVEQYIYQKLNCPDIEIVGQVASKLKKGFTPPWINQKINVTEVEDKKETHTCAIFIKRSLRYVSNVFFFKYMY